jgi:hypothetical protein
MHTASAFFLAVAKEARRRYGAMRRLGVAIYLYDLYREILSCAAGGGEGIWAIFQIPGTDRLHLSPSSRHM